MPSLYLVMECVRCHLQRKSIATTAFSNIENATEYLLKVIKFTRSRHLNFHYRLSVCDWTDIEFEALEDTTEFGDAQFNDGHLLDAEDNFTPYTFRHRALDL